MSSQTLPAYPLLPSTDAVDAKVTCANSTFSDESTTCATTEDGKGDTSSTKPPIVVAVAPTDFQSIKYCTRVVYPSDQKKATPKTIPTLKSSFKAAPAPSGWERHIAPEGNPYFRATSNPFLTPEDPAVDEDIDAAASALLLRLREHHDAPSDTEIIVGKARNHEGEDVFTYYCASMAMQTVFWLEEVESSLMVDGGGRVVVSEAHLGLAAKSQFWTHVELFPNHCTLSEEVIRELKDIYTHGYMDRLTSLTSTFPFTPKKLGPLRECIDGLRPDEPNAYLTTVAARLLCMLYNDRFKNFYGELGARLDSTSTVVEAEPAGRVAACLFAPVSILLFGLPSLYLKEIRDVYNDSMIHYADWERFLAQCSKDRQELLVPTPILLVADLGVLVLAPEEHAAVRALCCVSSILLCSSFLTSQVLGLFERGFRSRTASAAIQYISKWVGLPGGLHSFATSLSLPKALFLWGLATFAASLMTAVIQSSGLATQVSIIAVLGTMGVLLAALLWIELDCRLLDTERIAGLCRSFVNAVRLPRRNRETAAQSVVSV